VIRVANLTKRYGAHLAVDDVSFQVGKGEVVGFLGPNGAGKSTTLRILAGFLGASSGTVVIAGHDVNTDALEARRSIGYMPEDVPLYPEMRVVEYLRFRAELKGVPRAKRRGHIDDALGRANVTDVANKSIGHLSKGYRQRVGLADALVAKPPIVVLDEPTAGLDPNQIREARALVRELGRDHTVVLSTHILSEVEACATRVLLLHRGKLVAGGPTEEIRALQGPAGVEVTAHGDRAVAEGALRSTQGVTLVERLDPGVGAADDAPAIAAPTRFRVTFEGPCSATAGAQEALAQATERCVAALVAAGVGVREVRPARGSLEDVFAALTKDAERSPQPGVA
jgi:ABC-2 type transport system ATP-binding protein